MNTFFCIMMFILGSFFGSFFTLAVYRLPLGKDITHERSFCPNCNHKLGALDLFPVLSYIFLRGKCRYCGEKIRIRYLLFEILSGTVFVLMYLSYNMTYPYLNFLKTLNLISFIMMYVVLAILAGIDKEKVIIQKNVLMFGFCMNLIYNTYLYYGLNLHNVISINANIFFSVMAVAIYGIYLYFVGKKEVIIIGKNNIDEKIKNNKQELLKKIKEEKERRFKSRYNIDCIMCYLYILINTNVQILIVVLALNFIVKLIHIILKKKMPVAFYICIFTIVLNLAYNVSINY